MKDGPDPLERAVELTRAEPVDPPGWEDVAGSVMRRVRATVRPGRRIQVALPDAGGGATYVSDRVLVAALRSALGDLDGLAPSRIRVEVADDRCTAVEVELVARYGTDLQLLGDRCHEIVNGRAARAAARRRGRGRGVRGRRRRDPR